MVHCDFTKITELDISKSEQLDWVYSYEIDDYRNPLSIPFAETGFKTLWVNENQRVTVKSQSGSKSISFVDKNWKKHIGKKNGLIDLTNSLLRSTNGLAENICFK